MNHSLRLAALSCLLGLSACTARDDGRPARLPVEALPSLVPEEFAGRFRLVVLPRTDPDRPESRWCYLDLRPGPGRALIAQAARPDDVEVTCKSAAFVPPNGLRLVLERRYETEDYEVSEEWVASGRLARVGGGTVAPAATVAEGGEGGEEVPATDEDDEREPGANGDAAPARDAPPVRFEGRVTVKTVFNGAGYREVVKPYRFVLEASADDLDEAADALDERLDAREEEEARRKEALARLEAEIERPTRDPEELRARYGMARSLGHLPRERAKAE
ncbi:MAG: hypothetical protein D6731_12260 [Planctomycetota bacterium]|nr:MAG: hypothetical protein D6731_12260 [Planctomycetota bacterium]